MRIGVFEKIDYYYMSFASSHASSARSGGIGQGHINPYVATAQ